MDIELEKLKKLEHALHDAIDILRDWQVEEVKQEKEKFIAYLARPKYGDCYLTACAEGMWEAVQKEYGAKAKLFVGTCDEAVEWYESREKFTEIIKAWEDVGYTKKYMTATIDTIELINGKGTELRIDAPVYTIHLSGVKEAQ